jgi:hypothetical protein
MVKMLMDAAYFAAEKHAAPGSLFCVGKRGCGWIAESKPDAESGV